LSEDESSDVSIEANETNDEDHVEITIGDAAEEEEVFSPLDFLLNVPGLGKSQANSIIMMGYRDKESILNLTEEELVKIPDLPVSMANRILMKIKETKGEEKEEEEVEEEKEVETKKAEAPEEPAAAVEAQESEEGSKEEQEDKEAEKEEVVFKIKDEEGDGEEAEASEAEEDDGAVAVEVGAADDAPADTTEEEKEGEKKKEEGGGFFGKLKSIFGGGGKKEEKKDEKPAEEVKKEELKIEGVDPEKLKLLSDAGYQDAEELKEAIVEDLTMIEGIDEDTAKEIYSKLHPDE
jgi:ribosomal protein S13